VFCAFQSTMFAIHRGSTQEAGRERECACCWLSSLPFASIRMYTDGAPRERSIMCASANVCKLVRRSPGIHTRALSGHCTLNALHARVKAWSLIMISTGARSLHKLKANRSDESEASKRASKSSAACCLDAARQAKYICTYAQSVKTKQAISVAPCRWFSCVHGMWHPALFSAPKLMHPFAIFEAAPSCAVIKGCVTCFLFHAYSLFCK
jgi:hypothetical protein